jgi:hypothetical protein
VALPHPDWYRGGAMREDIATLNFAEFDFHALRRIGARRRGARLLGFDPLR